MHLVSESLPLSVSLLTSVAGVVSLGAACYGARRELSAEQVPAFFAMTGFVFIAQMVNCSTGLGFSGHLLGAALLAVLLGPFAAMLSMAAVLTGQAAVLGDGSISTLGANFLNMGVVAPWAAHLIFHSLQRRHQWTAHTGQFFAMALASYGSVIAATLSMSYMFGGQTLELLSTHAVIGAFEVVVSLSVFAATAFGVQSYRSTSRCGLRLIPITVSCALCICLAPFSSQLPDGLEHVLETPVSVTVQ
jgi:cobalt/nickel transport system permease protein